MEYFSWNSAKNESLKKARGVSFEEVVFYIDRGDLLDVLEHPHPKRYPRQRIFIVNTDDDAYLVPFVEREAERFLKTIIPTRPREGISFWNDLRTGSCPAFGGRNHHMRRIGIVGVGLLGSAVATRLLQRGFEVMGYDTRAPQVEALVRRTLPW